MLKFVACAALVCLASGVASAAVVDLNDFYADPSVSVAADGSSASFSEDAFASVILSNDPGFGDPEVILAAVGRTLSFDYVFTLGGVGNLDEFGAFLIDGDTGISVGSPFEFFLDTSGVGTVTFDLSSLVGGPSQIGLQFQLSALPSDSGFDSTLTISNVQTVDAAATAVPLPTAAGSGIGLLVGLSVVGLVRRKWGALSR